jgi:cysteine desulfurase
MKSKSAKRIFFDHASATPVLPEVVDSMMPFFSDSFENPSALYKEAVFSKQTVLHARKQIASILKALPDEIIFTGSGTEADNLALRGIFSEVFNKSTNAQKNRRPHIIISPFEHSAIREVVAEFAKNGGLVSTLPLYSDGRVKPEDVEKLLSKNTILVSVMYANNEIGTIQPIKHIAKVIRHFNKFHANKKIYFHTDASQAANYLNLNVLELGVDMMTLDASKIYGPKGIGMLFVKRGIPLSAHVVGGGQEGGRRSGTENVPAIVGFAKALSIVQGDAQRESKRLTRIRDVAIQTIVADFPSSHLNGSALHRLPNNINMCIKGIDAEFVTLMLDVKGFAVSTTSSCEAQSDDPRSIAVEALGVSGCAQSSLRITLGRSTTSQDMKKFISALKKVLS